MRQFVRDPPKDKILPKKYWKHHSTGDDYKLQPMGFKECIICGLYFPIFGRGFEPKRCYRCSCNKKEITGNRLRSVVLTKENYEWILNEKIKNFSFFINTLIEDRRKDE